MTAATANDLWSRERSWLGHAGLVPFLGCAALLFAIDDPAQAKVAEDALRYYAAVIASFLGAVHWGVAATDPEHQRARLRWGVMPSLVAWMLLLLPAKAAFYGFALLFAVILMVDRQLLPLPDPRYRQLRLRLSIAVILTMLTAALTASQIAA